MVAKNLFANRHNGVVVRVGPVDDSYAWIVSVTGPATRYAMPIREYDGGAFVRGFRPATEEDLQDDDGSDFRLPGDAPAEWRGEPVEGIQT